MKMLDEYFNLEHQILDYFGYVQGWRVYPLEDSRGYYWMVVGNPGAMQVVTSKTPFTEESIVKGVDIASSLIVNDTILRKEGFTMIPSDTSSDGNIFCTILDNKFECTDEKLRELYDECW